jgi:NADH:ubiquinone reductase (H+-translocating)
MIMTAQHRVVIIGGGFGGLHAATSLKNAPVQVTLIDRRNFHLFQPLLYQVATGALSPANIAAPLRDILKKQSNAEVILGDVIDIDAANHTVRLSDGDIPYDTLIVAAGMQTHYFGHNEWQVNAPGLKTVEDATEMRRRVLLAFEAAERETDPNEIQKWLTFVVIGGGPTGVELAGALGEIANHTLKHNFRRINPARARIILLEGGERVLATYPPDLSVKATQSLVRLGADVRTHAIVTQVDPGGVTFRNGETSERIAAYTVLWGAGVKASPLGQKLADSTGAQVDRAGRLMVHPDLTLPNHPEIFVIGDLANYPHQTGQPLPGVAQVAMQQGDFAARLIQARLHGKTLRSFRYLDFGNMATIGRAAAVADLGKLHFSGWIGWLMWLFIHLLYIVQYQSRLLVLIQWGWTYFTRNRSARLITGGHVQPIHHADAADSYENDDRRVG